MATIEIERLVWHRPSRLGVSSYEHAKAVIGDSKFGDASIEQRRSQLSPSLLGRDYLIETLKFEGKLYAVGIVAGALTVPVEEFSDWVNFGEGLAYKIGSIVVLIVFVVIMFVLMALSFHLVIRLVTFWPSVLIYFIRNRVFVRKRFNAVKKSSSYEEYLDLET